MGWTDLFAPFLGEVQGKQRAGCCDPRDIVEINQFLNAHGMRLAFYMSVLEVHCGGYYMMLTGFYAYSIVGSKASDAIFDALLGEPLSFPWRQFDPMQHALPMDYDAILAHMRYIFFLAVYDAYPIQQAQVDDLGEEVDKELRAQVGDILRLESALPADLCALAASYVCPVDALFEWRLAAVFTTIRRR